MSEKKPDSERIRDLSPMGIRLPADLKSRIADAAKLENISMNSMIVRVLDDAFPEDLTIKKEILLTKAAYFMEARVFRSKSDPAEADDSAIKEKYYFFIRRYYPKVDPILALSNLDLSNFDRLELNEVSNWARIIEREWEDFGQDQNP